MNNSRKVVFIECHEKLLNLRAEFKKRLKRPYDYHVERGLGDKSSKDQMIQDSSYFRTRLEKELLEVEHALLKFELGTYGLCELTGSQITEKRLLAMPWTRFALAKDLDDHLQAS